MDFESIASANSAKGPEVHVESHSWPNRAGFQGVGGMMRALVVQPPLAIVAVVLAILAFSLYILGTLTLTWGGQLLRRWRRRRRAQAERPGFPVIVASDPEGHDA
jgi:hypothetical protein